MIGKDIFKIWAPEEAKWTEWVRPVPFVTINNLCKKSGVYHFEIPFVSYIRESHSDTAVIIDIPGYDSIKEGLALAKLGFRPIPIYNGTNAQDGAMALIDNNTIGIALRWGASELKKVEIPLNAPPVFLLDSNRVHRFKMNVSVYDNSWDIYAQDMPSAEYFLNNGIYKIIVRGEKMQKDLTKILYNFQKKGVDILFTNGYEVPKSFNIKKPSERKNGV